MTKKDPPIHVITEDGKLRICLSIAAKWAAGIVASLLTAIATGAFLFAWDSNLALGQIITKLENMNQRLDHYYERLERIDAKVDDKQDRVR
jgi:hypothetical protein